MCVKILIGRVMVFRKSIDFYSIEKEIMKTFKTIGMIRHSCVSPHLLHLKIRFFSILYQLFLVMGYLSYIF